MTLSSPAARRRAVAVPHRSRRTVAARVLAAAALLVAFVVGAPQVAGAVPSTPVPDACAQLMTQAQALLGQIDAHNSRTVNDTSAAEVAAYNAEADALNDQRDALNTRLTTCQDTEDAAQQALSSGHPGDYSYQPTQERVAAVDSAMAGIDRTYVAPGPTPQGTYRVTPELRQVYSALRSETPRGVGSARLQGEPRPAVGDPDPAFPGATIQGRNGAPQVAVDHIIPLTELISTPGFLQLSSENMLRVVNAPVNLQWLSTSANLAKGARSMAAVARVDPAFRTAQEALATDVRARLQNGIQLLLQLQQAAAP